MSVQDITILQQSRKQLQGAYSQAYHHRLLRLLLVDTGLMTSLMTSSCNNLSRHFYTMFPYMVCLYIAHVPFGVTVDTFSPTSERTISPTGLFIARFTLMVNEDFHIHRVS